MEVVDKLNLLRSKGKNLNHDYGYKSSNLIDDNSENHVDEDKLNRGISFFQENFFTMFVSMLTGLFTLMYVDTIAAVLYTTNKSNSPSLSFSRYLSTLNHTVEWYQSIPKLLQSTSKVRQLHKKASKLKNFSQYEMVITQWAFVGPVLLWPEQFGVAEKSRQKLDGLLYIIYHVGKELGICEEFNLCSGTREEIEDYCRLILREEIQPKFLSPESSTICRNLADNLLSGVHLLNPFINPNGFRAWTEKTVHVKEEVDTSDLEQFSMAMYKLQLKVFQLFHFPLIGTVLRSLANNLMKLNIFLATEFQHKIVEDQLKPKVEMNKYLSVIYSMFVISILVSVSFLKAVQNIFANIRSELIVFIALSILSVIIFSMS